jgi:hypothetical protein
VLCLSVLEHLWDPSATLRGLHRVARAGFLPSGIRCTRHKLGLNTFAACTLPVTGARP